MSCFLFFFFFKQKTAYEMRISDWSSDVCSSDLLHPGRSRSIAEGDGDLQIDGRGIAFLRQARRRHGRTGLSQGFCRAHLQADRGLRELWLSGEPCSELCEDRLCLVLDEASSSRHILCRFAQRPRSEERRVGNECGSPCRSRW